MWPQYRKCGLGLELFGFVLRLSLVFQSWHGKLLAKRYEHLLAFTLLLILFKMQYDIFIT